MSEPVVGVRLSVTDERGWVLPEPSPLLSLGPGFADAVPRIALDLVRAQITRTLDLYRGDLVHTRAHVVDLEAQVALLEAALAELDGAK